MSDRRPPISPGQYKALRLIRALSPGVRALMVGAFTLRPASDPIWQEHGYWKDSSPQDIEWALLKLGEWIR